MNHDEFLQKVMASDAFQAIGNVPVLVALSGGADSVALLRLLLEADYDCYAAHCNFHLRDAESMRDEQFVRDLCQRLNVPLTVKDFDVPGYQAMHGGSVEMACRELRYGWFEQERREHDCAFIAVAHHADDQVETFFLNLMRGTGLRGLTGMERISHRIWRPLLTVTRAEILDYLESICQDYVTDSTNAHNDYRRNRLRNIVLPTLGQHFSHAHERIIDTMDNLQRDHDLLAALVDELLPDERHISIETLITHPYASTLLFHRIRHHGFNFDQCEQAIIAAMQGRSGSQFLGKDRKLVVERGFLSVEPIKKTKDFVIPLDLSSSLVSPIHLIISNNNPPFSPLMCDGKNKVAFNTQLLDCQHIVLRHWKRGDRIKPFGMKGSKLVSDLFADFKLDHATKQSVWLLEADGDILWILGYRASALYSVPTESQDYLLMSWK